MSAYTSFVAIDSEVRNPGGEGQTVSVPVPLPDQVSPLAAPGHAYVTGNAVKYKAQEALSGFLCRKQAVPPSAGIGRDERACRPDLRQTQPCPLSWRKKTARKTTQSPVSGRSESEEPSMRRRCERSSRPPSRRGPTTKTWRTSWGSVMLALIVDAGRQGCPRMGPEQGGLGRRGPARAPGTCPGAFLSQDRGTFDHLRRPLVLMCVHSAAAQAWLTKHQPLP